MNMFDRWVSENEASLKVAAYNDGISDEQYDAWLHDTFELDLQWQAQRELGEEHIPSGIDCLAWPGDEPLS